MRSPPELRRNPFASRDSGGRKAKQGKEVNKEFQGVTKYL
jgi:hypothetical protein